MRRAASIAVAALAVLEAALLIHQASFNDSVTPFLHMLGLSMVGFLLVGAYSIVRRPRHRVGWALVGIGVGVATVFLSDGYLIALVSEEARPYLYVWTQPVLVAGFTLIAFFLLWYPTGELSSSGWRWVERAIIVVLLVHVVYLVLRPGELSTAGIENPIGWDVLGEIRNEQVEEAAGLFLIALVVSCLGSLLMRYRKSSWTVRRQIHLILYPALAFVVAYAVAIFLDARLAKPLDLVFVLLPVLGFNAIAMGVGVAIARYRLYEVDRVISRTVSYFLVLGLLALVFAAGVVWIPSALDLDQSPLLVATTTLAIAALFNPLRTRTHRWVDRRFNRSHYDAGQVADQFGVSLQERVTLDSVVDRWVGVVSETMQPSSVGVWLRR